MSPELPAERARADRRRRARRRGRPRAPRRRREAARPRGAGRRSPATTRTPGVRDDALTMLRDIALDVVRGRQREPTAWRPWTRSPMHRQRCWRRSPRRRCGRRSASARCAADRARRPHVAPAGVDRQARARSNRSARRRSSGVHERADILAVAINGEFKEIAVAAVDRLAERERSRTGGRAREKQGRRQAGQRRAARARRARRDATPRPRSPPHKLRSRSCRWRYRWRRTIVDERHAGTANATEPKPTRVREEAEEKQRAGAGRRARERAAREAEQAPPSRPPRSRRRARHEAEAAPRSGAAPPGERGRSARSPRGPEPAQSAPRARRALAQKPDLSLKTADARAARRPSRARRRPAAAVEARLRRGRAAAEGRAGRADAKGAGPARGRRVAAVGEHRHPGAALREDGGASDGREIPKPSRAGSASCRSSGARPPTCLARRARRCGAASRAAHDEVWARCEAHFAAQAGVRDRESREEDRALRAGRGARRLDQLAADRRRDQGPAGRVENHRPGDARTGKGHLGTVPRRAAIGSSPGARTISPSARRVWTENFAKKEALCVAVEALADVDRLGTARPPRSGGCRRSGRRSGR